MRAMMTLGRDSGIEVHKLSLAWLPSKSALLHVKRDAGHHSLSIVITPFLPTKGNVRPEKAFS